ncbi:MAG: ABC transporter substrate-binding protein [Deltaproteobacteria bacterium]|nr:ABC transporter substrate-binding protein [Deltaproteobacteria bacterium]
MTLRWLLLFFAFGVEARAASDSALARTEALVAAFKAVKAPPEGKTLSDADRAANKKVFAELDGYFDYGRITSDPVAPHKKKFSKAQLSEFAALFREVIRLVAYTDSGAFLSSATLDIKAGPNKGKRSDVLMHAAVAEDDIETDVTFHWESTGGTLRVVDVSFDGASLVADYKAQFGRIIDKDGVTGLIDKIKKKLDEKRKENVLAP